MLHLLFLFDIISFYGIICIIITLKKEGRTIKEFIKSPSNFISFAIAILPSVLLWVLQPSDTISYVFFAIAILICLILLWLYLMTLLQLKEDKKVNRIQLIECHNDICLCNPTDIISQDSLVSFYILENNFEDLIGHGYVTNIQENKIIQIKMLNATHCEPSNLINLLNTHRKDIIIKPTVSYGTIKSILDRS